MSRSFDEHIRRNTKSLDGSWSFRTDPEDRGKNEKWFCKLQNADTITVPSVWNTRLGLLEYEGVAWYEKQFYTEGGCLQFCFGGVMTEADVWLDGVYLGNHYGGFCQFSFIARNITPGLHRLTVRADNRFDPQSIPQARVDWYHYGGITRSVSVHQLQKICVLHQRLEYTLSQDLSSALCRFVLELYNADTEEASSPVTAQLDGRNVYAEEITLSPGEKRTLTTPEFTVSPVRLWDTADPQLYSILCSTDTDDLIDRTGFRQITTQEGKILLNGKPIEIRGINRHEEHPDWGMAFPAGLMERDLDIIQDLGCNSIRGSHYPNSQNFLDMLDSRGIIFWSEIPIWGVGFSPDTLADPKVVARGLEMHQEMVRYYYNHPSILFWGLHNEIRSDTEPGYAMTRQYYALLKETGGNRLVTFASCHPTIDICLEFCDIISLNRYVGWYYGKKHSWQEELDTFRQRRKELGLGDKPVLYSEFGCAAVYGHHTFDNLKGTEEFQADYLEDALQTFHKDPMVAGFYIWQFCDIRTSQEMGLTRSRSYNNKGILNEYRKPKLSYYAVRRAYRSFAQESQE